MAIPTYRTVSSVEPDDITLHRRLTGLRRRARTILLARYLLVVLCLAVAAGSVAVLWPIAVPAVAWAAALVVAGVSVVALVLLRTPDTREIAVSVDRRLHLADATVMALSLRGSRDPIARLIVRDTLARMTVERMVSACPFELGRPAISVVGATVVCVVVMAGINRWPQASMSSPGGGIRIASPGAQTPPSQRSSVAADGSADQLGSSATQAPQSGSATPAEADASVQKTDAAPDGIADSQTERPSALGATDAPVSRSASSAGRTDAQQTGASPRAQAARAGGAGGSAGDEDASKTSGGVQRGRLQDGAAAAPSAADYGSAYRTARTRVDAAIARDEIPRSRRAYVRDYFLAIAPRD